MRRKSKAGTAAKLSITVEVAPRVNDEPQQLDARLRAFINDLAKFAVERHLAGFVPEGLRLKPELTPFRAKLVRQVYGIGCTKKTVAELAREHRMPRRRLSDVLKASLAEMGPGWKP